MSDRPTPETDALDHELHNPKVLQDRYSAILDHARKLERERDELLAYLDAAHYATCNAELRRERDEARDAAQRLRVENNHNWQAMEMAEQAFRERNLAINFLLDIRRNEGRVILSQLDEVLAKLDAL